MELFKWNVNSRNYGLYITSLLVLLLVIGVIGYGVNKVEQQVRIQTIDSLRTILYSSHDTLSRIWLKNIYYDAGEVLSSFGAEKYITRLLSLQDNSARLRSDAAQKILRQNLLKHLGHLSGTGFEIISPDYINISSLDKLIIGKKTIIEPYYPIKLARVFAGMPQFIPPVHDKHEQDETHDIKNEHNAVMFYLVPIRASNGRVIAALAVQLNPYQTIGSIAWTGRLGDTGETYLFDKEAWLVTESRFNRELVSQGLLIAGKSSIHNIKLRVPEKNREKYEQSSAPHGESGLTFMARNAVTYESGESTDGYRNYLGVKVLGVWLWDEQLGIGMATEIQEDEALAPYRKTRTIILGMLAITLLCMIVFSYFIRKLRQKNEAAIKKSEAYLSVVLENAADGIITIDDEGIIQTFNLEAEKLFQYSAAEAIGQNVNLVIPAFHKLNTETELDEYQKTGKRKLLDSKSKLEGLRKDGSTFPISISLSEIKQANKKIFVAIVRDLSMEIQTKEKLQRYQDELESLVDERTSALLESEALNRQILESAGEGVYGLNLQGEVIFINPAGAKMLGYGSEELIGEYMHDLVHHSYPDGSRYPRNECPMYAAYLKGESSHIDDEVLWRRDGNPIPVEYTSRPIYRDEEIIGAVVTFSDITERLTVEEKLRDINTELENRVKERTLELHRSEIVLNRAQRIAHLGSWIWDIAGGTLAWSDEIYRIFGLDSENFEPSYEAFVESIYPDDRDAVTNAVNESISDPDAIYSVDHRIILPDGGIKYVHEQGEVEWGNNGKPIQMIGIVHDITEQKKTQNVIKQALEELAKSERVLRLALSGAGAGYWHYEINKGLLYWDEQSLALFGVEEDEFSGQLEDWAKRVHEKDLASATAAFTNSLEDKNLNVLYLDYRIKKPDGEIRYIHVTGHIERDKLQQATSVYGLHFDVTENKHAEQELIRAMESAEVANRAKSEFLAVMSHEIRTPMNAIIGMSNLVMNTDLTPRQQSYLKKVVGSAESLLHIINDILDFSKIEAGKLSMETIDFRLDEVFDKLTHLVVLKAQEKGLEFLFSIRPEIPGHLRGDPTRLLQILVNLASNAVKFTEHGEIVLSVEMETSDDDQVVLRFTVRDTGVGIEKEKQKRLFQSFSQADASITRKFGGTGLGLVIVKRLVKLMGGEISFESEPGVGTSFHFSVPFGRSRTVGRIDHALPDNVANLSVLVVDDSESARTILGETLEGFGFKVDLAATVNEAISAVETAEQRGEPYRLVLMDWKMPEHSGVEGAKTILGQSKSTAPPVVMMVTAYNAEDLAGEIENIAISSTLMKPVSPSSLLDAILSAFHQQDLKQGNEPDASSIASPYEQLAGASILIVEDNELNMELTVELLQEVGIQTSSATNGEEALKALEDNNYDGILMDVHMPVMDGMEATRRIRQQSKFESLPIIALTADALESDREDIIAAGMNDVVVKPIKVDLMLATMAKWIRSTTTNSSIAGLIHSPSQNPIKIAIQGIDTDAGLETCNGKVSLYQKLLKKFINEKEFLDKFQESMEKGDMELAERLAHTMKGTSGNIGAKGVQQAAKNLQDAIKEKSEKTKIDELYKELENELIPVIQALDKIELELIEDNVKPHDNIEIDALIPAFEELSTLLADDDTDATEVIDQIYHELKNSPYGDDVDEIAKYIGRYDFSRALESVSKLTKKIKAA